MKLKLICLFLISMLLLTSCTTKKEEPIQINSFSECVKAGNPVMESFPRQCRYNDQTFTEQLNICETSDDCIPKPGCHPKECINKDFENVFEKPEACTMIFIETAAYNKEDCICQNNICTNSNIN